MKCFSPTSIRDPSVIGKSVRITVPCGKCAACVENKRNDWATRLRLEAKYQESAYFITLTYSPENITYVDVPNMDGEPIYRVATLVKADVQNFVKKLRKGIKEKIRYFVVGEYGTKTWRPHYHMILFGINKSGPRLLAYLLKKWDKGMIKCDPINVARIRYVTNYIIQKQDFQNEFIQAPFSLMSKGIGSQYIEKHTRKHQKDLERNYIVFEDGQKSRVPRYFRKKMLSRISRDKQNEITREKLEEQTERNWEKWAKNNPNVNKFEYEYDSHRVFTEKKERTFKKNNTL